MKKRRTSKCDVCAVCTPHDLVGGERISDPVPIGPYEPPVQCLEVRAKIHVERTKNGSYYNISTNPFDFSDTAKWKYVLQDQVYSYYLAGKSEDAKIAFAQMLNRDMKSFRGAASLVTMDAIKKNKRGDVEQKVIFDNSILEEFGLEKNDVDPSLWSKWTHTTDGKLGTTFTAGFRRDFPEVMEVVDSVLTDSREVPVQALEPTVAPDQYVDSFGTYGEEFRGLTTIVETKDPAAAEHLVTRLTGDIHNVANENAKFQIQLEESRDELRKSYDELDVKRNVIIRLTKTIAELDGKLTSFRQTSAQASQTDKRQTANDFENLQLELANFKIATETNNLTIQEQQSTIAALNDKADKINAELRYFTNQVSILNSTEGELNGALTRLQLSTAEYKTEVERLQRENEVLVENTDKASRDQSLYLEKILQLETDLAEVRGELDIAKAERLAALQEVGYAVEKTNTMGDKRILQLTSKLKNMLAEKAASDRANATIIKELQVKYQTIFSGNSTELAATKALLDQSILNLRTAEGQLVLMNGRIADATNQLEELQVTSGQDSVELVKLATENREIRGQIEVYGIQQKLLAQSNTQLSGELANNNEALRDLNIQLNEVREQKAQLILKQVSTDTARDNERDDLLAQLANLEKTLNERTGIIEQKTLELEQYKQNRFQQSEELAYLTKEQEEILSVLAATKLNYDAAVSEVQKLQLNQDEAQMLLDQAMAQIALAGKEILDRDQVIDHLQQVIVSNTQNFAESEVQLKTLVSSKDQQLLSISQELLDTKEMVTNTASAAIQEFGMKDETINNLVIKVEEYAAKIELLDSIKVKQEANVDKLTKQESSDLVYESMVKTEVPKTLDDYRFGTRINGVTYAVKDSLVQTILSKNFNKFAVGLSVYYSISMASYAKEYQTYTYDARAVDADMNRDVAYFITGAENDLMMKNIFATMRNPERLNQLSAAQNDVIITLTQDVNSEGEVKPGVWRKAFDTMRRTEYLKMMLIILEENWLNDRIGFIEDKYANLDPLEKKEFRINAVVTMSAVGSLALETIKRDANIRTKVKVEFDDVNIVRLRTTLHADQPNTAGLGGLGEDPIVRDHRALEQAFKDFYGVDATSIQELETFLTYVFPTIEPELPGLGNSRDDPIMFNT